MSRLTSPMGLPGAELNVPLQYDTMHCDGMEYFVPISPARWRQRHMATKKLTGAAGLSGRKAQAARNNQLILDAARSVFTADPGAPISAVAEQAGVGMSALYRRYRSKDELLQQLCLDGLGRYIAAAEVALAAEEDPWTAFAVFMRRCLDDGAGSLTLRFAGSFTATDELNGL